MNASEIRESFLSFFESKSHQRVKSSGLIPEKDPTLFFTNAGMVQFKSLFLGEEKSQYSRATTSQKCMRVSGKHNDLENVGVTLRHHTFFEMLGNFSFGDYFKQDAILYAWEFLTGILKLPKDRLYATVFLEDDEAEKLWYKLTDLEKGRVSRFGEKDNFWSMGPTGPCGPCSEIFYDHGPNTGCGQADCKVGCECDRFMEVWNLVFMQYDRSEDGQLTALPKPSVDTGMGLERLACVVQGKHSNYDSDLFTVIFKEIESLSALKYGADEKQDISMRVLADHIRSSVFLISEGIQTSNEGRGYVLRRIMRRAIRHGRNLGFKEPFFYRLVAVIVAQMGDVYPELKQNQSFIEEVILAEEKRFLATLEKGLQTLSESIAKNEQEKIISGEDAFLLYDTYGFPLDLTQVIAAENQFKVDLQGFEQLMQEQKNRARAAWKGSGEEKLAEIYQSITDQSTEFVGYESLESKAKILGIISQGKIVSECDVSDSNHDLEIVLDQTPFYAESGGQVGDQGVFRAEDGKGILAIIGDVKKPKEGLFIHKVSVLKGSLRKGQKVFAQVDEKTRLATKANHSATHLLQAALQTVLGDHVKQAGSLVGPERLRFDFSHFNALKSDEIVHIEQLVNAEIRKNHRVDKSYHSYQEALNMGALALFGEKYGDEVRVVQMGEFSTELCGGTHVNSTGDIGFFKILSDSSVAAGVRRIEALTGERALNLVQEQEALIKGLCFQLKTSPEQVPERINVLQKQIKQLEKKLVDAQSQGSSGQNLDELIREINGIKVLASQLDLDDIKALRQYSDQLKNKIRSGITLALSASDGKVSFIVTVSKEWVTQFKAGELVKNLAPIVDGKGGGRPDMAQAGGSKVAAIPQLIEHFYQLIEL